MLQVVVVLVGRSFQLQMLVVTVALVAVMALKPILAELVLRVRAVTVVLAREV